MDKATRWALNQDKLEEQARKKKELQNYNQFYYLNKTKKERRLRTIEKNYGLTVKDFDFILQQQEGVCGVCKCHEPRTGWVVDHCHTTGAIRVILCSACNWFLANW